MNERRKEEELSIHDMTAEPSRFGICESLVDEEFPQATPEVRAAILEYAEGNLGCARLLAQACKDRCATAYNVAEVVGWSLPPHERGTGDEVTAPGRQEAGWQLYLRLKSGYAQ